ncbi:Ribokinase [Penicillium roqueforti FM164]|uniref:Ribokinase n=1 Tax=Penicillium roqueforti (strain FM164) TaxID=1365484 RepID=W6Q089_PENRF|nr:Ribokinase [Penicillium roqueforti FM164]
MAPLIRVIGSLNVDMVSVTPRFPNPGETITSSSYFTSAGGKGANQAVACGPASVSHVLNTTGAGDTFVGAYAVRVARWREQRRADGKAGQDLADDEKAYRYKTVMDEAMHVAARASARAVERQGAMDSIPFENEV